MNFSENIKILRRNSMLSQEEFAKEIGVSFSTVNRWETGKAMPNYKTMKKIKSFCDKRNLECPDRWENIE